MHLSICLVSQAEDIFDNFNSFVGFDWLLTSCVGFLFCSLVPYEGLEVVNPEGGTEDAEEEASKGRWKQEVHRFLLCFVCGDELKLVQEAGSIE